MSVIFAIDPGPVESGIVVWENEKIDEAGIVSNIEIIERLRLGAHTYDAIAIERIRGYGIVAGNDTFDTCEAIGQFTEAAQAARGNVILIGRKEIKKHLCGNTTTNDKYIRQALIGRYGEPGTRRAPGRLYGVSGHMWSALAVAVTAAETSKHDL